MDARGAIVRAALNGIRDHEKWEWAEYRPCAPVNVYKEAHIKLDCGKAVQSLFYTGDAPDPMKTDYGDWGNTTTLFHSGVQIELAHAEPGDVAVFGPEGEVHGALFISGGDTAHPVLFSHGQPGDPSLVPLEALLGLGEPTYLRFPTPASSLSPSSALVQSRGFVLLQDPTDEQIALDHGWHLWAWNGWSFVRDDHPAPLPASRWADYRWPEKRPA